MKNKIFLLIILVLIFGFSLIGCDNGVKGTGGSIVYLSVNGTWYSYGNVYKYIFNSGNFEHYYNGNPYRRGTYTTTNDSMTMIITNIGRTYLSSYTTFLTTTKDWYTKDEVKTAYINYYRNQYRTSVQQTYDNYVAVYGVSAANNYFNSLYGTTNIDTIVNQLYGDILTNAGNSIDTSLNSLYSNSTVSYSLTDKLILGGITLTKE